MSVALLLAVLAACPSDQSKPGASAEDRPVTATVSSVAEGAAKQACSVYRQGFVWDSVRSTPTMTERTTSPRSSRPPALRCA